MKQSDRIAALEAAVKELQEQIAALRSGAPVAATNAAPATTFNGKYGLQIMVDEDEWEWYSDLTSGNKNLFDTQEEADSFGKQRWKFYRVVKLG
jgi:hypothetical protein